MASGRNLSILLSRSGAEFNFGAESRALEPATITWKADTARLHISARGIQNWSTSPARHDYVVSMGLNEVTAIVMALVEGSETRARPEVVAAFSPLMAPLLKLLSECARANGQT